MKPIELIISAFGPYPDKVSISFPEFEQQGRGLFLITGDTGAGKTTIFDAICFALYGETSGQYKGVKNLRSEYADINTRSYVELRFSHQGKEYTVCRTPSYTRPAKRADAKDQVEKSTVVFTPPDGLPVEGPQKVDPLIVQLLNINVGQFKQIAMIAQGEFLNLLNTSTEDREKILRNIFLTDGYDRLTDVLKGYQDTSKNGRTDTQKSIHQHLMDVKSPEGSPRAQDLEQFQSKESELILDMDITSMTDLISALVAEDEQRVEALERELATENIVQQELVVKEATVEADNKIVRRYQNLLKDKEALESRKEEIQDREAHLQRNREATHEVKPAYDLWQAQQAQVSATQSNISRTEQQLPDAEAKEQAAQTELNRAAENLSKADGLKVRIAQIEKDLPGYSRRDTLRKSIKALQQEAMGFDGRQAALEHEEAVLQKKIADLTERTNQLQNSPKELEQAKNALQQAKEQRAKLDTLLTRDFPTLERKQKAAGTAQAALQKAWAALDDASQKRADTEKALDFCRAGILAKQLEEGKPCPVCGSVHHPCPAELPADSVSEDDLKALKKAEVDAQSKKDAAATNAASAEKDAENAEVTLRRDAATCLKEWISEDLSLADLKSVLADHQAQVSQQIQTLNSRILGLQKDEEDRKNASDALENAREEEAKILRAKRDRLTEDMYKNGTAIAEKSAAMEPLEKLPYGSAAEAEKDKASFEEQSAAITARYNKALENSNAASEALTKLRSSLDTLRATLATQQQKETELKQTRDVKLAEHHFESLDVYLRYVSTEPAMAKEQKDIQDYYTMVQSNADQLAQSAKDAAGKEMQDLGAIQQARQAQEAKVKDLQQKKNITQNRAQANAGKGQDIQALQAPLQKWSQEYDVAKRLYDMAQGKVARRAKVRLEQYVQAAGFDGIIQAANRRLLPMSDNQFQLFRKENATGTNTFLDLEVLDNFTGRRRPVGTLSGGESFKASLSLALGLSDLVSSRSGGIQMEALFLDEGFGTLDAHSIQSALDILQNLTGSGKLVGVISHREELKSEIPQQIQVKKTQKGSSLTVELGI